MSQKYVHLMPWGASPFNIELVKFINKELNSKDHLFVVISKERLTDLNEFSNVLYENKYSLRVLFKYAAIGNYIILHSLSFSLWKLFFIKTRITRQIVWCVWGHDLYIRQSMKKVSGVFYFKLKKLIYWFYFRSMQLIWKLADYKIKQFAGIVVSCKGDGEEVKRRFGTRIKIFYSSYVFGYFNDDLDNLLINDDLKPKDSVNVLIGHSAFDFLKHKKYLDKLKIYKNENIKIVLPLCYGNMAYGDEIANYAKELYGEKALVFRDSMEWLDYCRLLKNIDIAIFDYEHQSALGNIAILFYWGKKIYLSKTGILSTGFKQDGITVYDCNEIGTVSFEELCKQDSPFIGIQYAKLLFDRKNMAGKWNSIFEYLK